MAVCCPLLAEPLPVQQLKASVEEMNYQLNAQATDLRLLEERILTLEKKSLQPSSHDSKLKCVETHQHDLSLDLCTLKTHLEKLQQDLLQQEKRLSQLDRKLEQDLTQLKQSLHTMLALLKADEEKSYTVKAGDSLGKIALDHKVSTKAIRDLNQLTSDVIYPGQNLKIP